MNHEHLKRHLPKNAVIKKIEYIQGEYSKLKRKFNLGQYRIIFEENGETFSIIVKAKK